jgi:hypothetical protein
MNFVKNIYVLTITIMEFIIYIYIGAHSKIISSNTRTFMRMVLKMDFVEF